MFFLLFSIVYNYFLSILVNEWLAYINTCSEGGSVETLSQLPYILTYFHHSCPAPIYFVYMQFSFNLPDITSFIRRCPTRLAVSTPLGKGSVLQLHSLVYIVLLVITYLNTIFEWHLWLSFTSITMLKAIFIIILYLNLLLIYMYVYVECKLELNQWEMYHELKISCHCVLVCVNMVMLLYILQYIDVLFMVWNGLYFSYHTKRWNTRYIYILDRR